MFEQYRERLCICLEDAETEAEAINEAKMEVLGDMMLAKVSYSRAVIEISSYKKLAQEEGIIG